MGKGEIPCHGNQTLAIKWRIFLDLIVSWFCVLIMIRLFIDVIVEFIFWIISHSLTRTNWYNGFIQSFSLTLVRALSLLLFPHIKIVFNFNRYSCLEKLSWNDHRMIFFIIFHPLFTSVSFVLFCVQKCYIQEMAKGMNNDWFHQTFQKWIFFPTEDTQIKLRKWWFTADPDLEYSIS